MGRCRLCLGNLYSMNSIFTYFPPNGEGKKRRKEQGKMVFRPVFRREKKKGKKGSDSETTKGDTIMNFPSTLAKGKKRGTAFVWVTEMWWRCTPFVKNGTCG